MAPEDESDRSFDSRIDLKLNIKSCNFGINFILFSHLGVLMIPIMLLGKPLYNRSMKNRQRRQQQNDQEHLLEDPPSPQESSGHGDEDRYGFT